MPADFLLEGIIFYWAQIILRDDSVIFSEGSMTVKRKAVLFKLLCVVMSFSSYAVIPIAFPSTAQAFTARDLMQGSHGSDVDELQGRLRLLGYYWGNIDGDFGWKTYWAVRTFQYNFGMEVTGYVDMKMKMKLVKVTPNWRVPSSNSSGSSSSTGSSGGHASTGPTSADQHTTQSTKGASSSFSKTYSGLTPHDLNLMEHIVYGEARGEPLQGQIAIAAVILNRLHSSKFPNSIPGIVYSPGAFDAVSDGQVNLTPNAEAKHAVMDAVNGMDPSHGAIFYFNPAKTSNAFVWSRPEITKIGHHIFTS